MIIPIDFGSDFFGKRPDYIEIISCDDVHVVYGKFNEHNTVYKYELGEPYLESFLNTAQQLGIEVHKEL